jgi:hypothetical protein
MTTGGSIFPSVACCRRARYQAKKAVGARIGFVRGCFSASRCRSKRLAMPYANLRGQIKSCLGPTRNRSTRRYATPRLAVITAAAKHHRSTVSNTRGLKPHLYRFTYSSSARYRGRLCAADSEDESTAVKEGSSRTNTLDLEPGAQLCDLLRAKGDSKARLR